MFFFASTIQKLLKQSFIYCHMCVFVNHPPKIPPSNQQTKETNENKKRSRSTPKKKNLRQALTMAHSLETSAPGGEPSTRGTVIEQ